jgi:molecular chaperone DnaJ
MPVLQRRGRGDQRILVSVQVPRHLNDEQRRLLHEFDQHADERTYGKSEGLFDKLKSAFR